MVGSLGLAAVPKAAVVTGSARGIGAAIARRLARDGYAVAVTDLEKMGEQAEGVVKEITAGGGKAIFAPIDVSDRDAHLSVVEKTQKAFGGLGVYVNNAGVAPGRQLVNVDPEHLELLYSVNVRGVLWGMQAAVKAFREQKTYGRIINASSIAGVQAFPDLGIYSSTKFAVRSLTQTAAREFAQYGVTVNSYGPGVVPTPMWTEIDRSLSVEKGTELGSELKNSLRLSLMDRDETAEDIAGLVSYLASDDAAYMTGSLVVIDGGIVFH